MPGCLALIFYSISQQNEEISANIVVISKEIMTLILIGSRKKLKPELDIKIFTIRSDD